MAAAYHHGTETIRIDGGSNPVYTVDGAITAIVGTAPVGAVNELTVCQINPIRRRADRQGLYSAGCRTHLDALRQRCRLCCQCLRPCQT